MILLFHMQIWIVLIMACVAVTHAMPRARGRGRGKPIHDVHERKDESCSFHAWNKEYKKRKKTEGEHGQRQGRGHTQCPDKIPSGVMGVWSQERAGGPEGSGHGSG